MNLVEAAEELTYVPTEQLTQMMSDPNSRHPSFLVLSEVQRRNQMKRSYDAQVAAQNKPETTVAQEAVAQLTGGLAGASSNQQLSSPNMGESPVGGGVPAPSGLEGMQMMAGGGRTGYSSRGLVEQALGYDPNLKNLRNRPEFGAGLNKLMVFADDPSLGMESYNRRMSRPRVDYTGLSNINLERLSEEEQEIARIEAIRKKADDLGIPLGTIQDIFSLDPNEKGQKFPTFVPKDKDFSGGFEPPKTEIETNTDNLYAGTDLSQNPILDGESREEAGPTIERLKEKSETKSQSDFEIARKQAESLYSGLNAPNLKSIKTDTSGLQSMLEGIPEFDRSKYQIDFDAPTAEDRAKDRQVRMLSGLAQVIGGAKNLGEMGAGVGKLSQNIQDMRKEARKEDLDLAKQRVSSEIAIDALAKGNREEKVLLNKTILQLEQADNVAEQNRILKMFELQSNRVGKELQATVDLLKNQTQENNIRRLSEQGRLDLYKEENDKLQDIATQISTSMGAQKNALMNQYREQKNIVDRIARVVRQDQYPDQDFSSMQNNQENDPLGIRR